MHIVAASKSITDMDESEEYRSRRWPRPMQPETVVLGLVLIGLLFSIVILGIGSGWFSSAFFPEQTDTSQDNIIEQYDKLLGGLLSPNFDNESCISRYRSSMYRKLSPFPASPYLIQKLRNYEEHHKECGPDTENYRKAVEQLKSGKSFEHADCQYIIWTQCCGLGNRMLSLISTFLFSILTNRVMLIDMTAGTHNLFCEPFPETSWVLPYEFPIKDFWRFDKNSPESYPSLVENKTINNKDALPAYVYLPLLNDHYRVVNHIFCEEDQKTLQKINWIILKSDGYYGVSFFLMSMYKEELDNMFPVKESLFHILGRYLFHPANPIWELIERYYETYLANVDERIGVQIRVFPQDNVTSEKMFDRILECSKNTNLLPELGPTKTNQTDSYYAKKRKAILVVSLFSEYYEKMKTMYYKNSTVMGEKVAVFQPSHEQTEEYNLDAHSQALVEIFLLSFSDKIATTSWSTFGYVAYSLGGLRPWIIRSPGWMQSGLEGACVRSESIDPCVHSPPILKCNGNKDLNVTEIVPFVRRCEDVQGGIKMFG